MDESDLEELEKTIRRVSTEVLDVNLNNPKNLDDEILFVANNYNNIDSTNIIFKNHEVVQNTPEFLLSVIKSDYVEYKDTYNTQIYQILLSVLTDLNYIKLNDTSMRMTKTIQNILPRIQQTQQEIEKMISHFLENLHKAKEQQTMKNNLLLLQAINSINIIESYIKKLNYARSMLLKRSLSQEHIVLIKDEMERAMKVTYGLPRIQMDPNLSIKEKLQIICDVYGGSKEAYSSSIIEQISALPRCGGVYSNPENRNYIAKRDKSWMIKFDWERHEQD